MWTPEILKTEDDSTLVWIAAPFEMPRISGELNGRTLMIGGIAHRVEATLADARPREKPIAKGERINLRVRPLPASEPAPSPPPADPVA